MLITLAIRIETSTRLKIEESKNAEEEPVLALAHSHIIR